MKSKNADSYTKQYIRKYNKLYKLMHWNYFFCISAFCLVSKALCIFWDITIINYVSYFFDYKMHHIYDIKKQFFCIICKRMSSRLLHYNDYKILLCYKTYSELKTKTQINNTINEIQHIFLIKNKNKH